MNLLNNVKAFFELKENFTVFNSYYLKEKYIEPVGKFSSLLIVIREKKLKRMTGKLLCYIDALRVNTENIDKTKNKRIKNTLIWYEEKLNVIG